MNMPKTSRIKKKSYLRSSNHIDRREIFNRIENVRNGSKHQGVGHDISGIHKLDIIEIFDIFLRGENCGGRGYRSRGDSLGRGGGGHSLILWGEYEKGIAEVQLLLG